MTTDEWSNAKRLLEQAIRKGITLGREGSSAREVVEVAHACDRHEYGGEPGFEVRIGVNSDVTLDIPWSMLRACFGELVSGGYDGKAFQRHYRKQFDVHPCHVHVVGMMFVLAGLATSDGRKQARYTPTANLGKKREAQKLSHEFERVSGLDPFQNWEADLACRPNAMVRWVRIGDGWEPSRLLL